MSPHGCRVVTRINRLQDACMKVVIAEKPSVARDIANVLKITEKKPGYIEGRGCAITWAIKELGKKIAVLDSKVTESEKYATEYQAREIDRKSNELEKLPAAQDEYRFSKAEYDSLTEKYEDEKQQKERVLTSAQQNFTERSCLIAEKQAACEQEWRQNINQIDEDRTQTLDSLESEYTQAKLALQPKLQKVFVDRDNLNREFKELADIKEPSELLQLRRTLQNATRKLREEAIRQERLRSQIALAKEKANSERDLIERDAVAERKSMDATIKLIEADRDTRVGELEKFDSSIAHFFQKENPQSWKQASKTLNRETLFRNAEEMDARLSTNNSSSVWGLEFSTEHLPRSTAGYNREELSDALQRIKTDLSGEHDKRQAAHERYLAVVGEQDKRVAEARNSDESEIQSSKELREKLQEETVRLENNIVTLKSQYEEDLKAHREKLAALERALKKEEARIHQDGLDLEERNKTRRNKVFDEFKAMRENLDEAVNLKLSGIADESESARKKHGDEVKRIERLFEETLSKQGVNTSLIQTAQKRVNKAQFEVKVISGYQTEVTQYEQLKSEFIDQLPFLKFERDRLSESQESKKHAQMQLVVRNDEAKTNLQVQQDKLDSTSNNLRADEKTIRRFQRDSRFAREQGFFSREDLAPAPFYRAKAISKFAEEAESSHERQGSIEKNGDRDARAFLNHFDTETLDRKILGFSPIHPHFDWFIFVGSELKPFVNGRGICGMKQIQTQEFEQLIRNICAKNADFKEGVRQVNQTAIAVEKHIKEHNFVDVLDSIELKVERVDSNLTRIISQLEEFADVNFSEDRDLFGKRADRSQVDKAIETFEKLLREIDSHRGPRLQLINYFDFIIRVHENGHDMGWRKSLDHIGSTGTDYLVKMLIYLSLIEIYRERAIDAKSGSVVHCILDETGVLAPKYVLSVLEYAQSRDIVLITAGHSQQTMGFDNWMHVRKCGSRFAAQTVLRKVLKCD